MTTNQINVATLNKLNARWIAALMDELDGAREAGCVDIFYNLVDALPIMITAGPDAYLARNGRWHNPEVDELRDRARYAASLLYMYLKGDATGAIMLKLADG